ncbi:MAG: T9SS type A sorting domain-containing protein [Bacteroidota bacterium]
MPTTMPSGYVLMQNYPNPFNPTTHITFSSAKTVQVQLIVSDLLGRQLATVFSGIASAQRMYTVAFDARNLASGIYLYSLRSPDGSIIKKMTVIK